METCVVSLALIFRTAYKFEFLQQALLIYFCHQMNFFAFFQLSVIV